MPSRWVSKYLQHMDEPKPFQRLGFPGCLEALPWSKAKCLARVPQPAGRRGQRFTRYGLVWLGLLTCPPFEGLPSHLMRDVRTTRKYRCQSRDTLFYNVVDVLLLHEDNLNDIYDWPQFRDALPWPLEVVGTVPKILLNLHARNISPVSEKLRRQAKNIADAFDLVKAACEDLTEEDYSRGRDPEPRATQRRAREQRTIRLQFLYEDLVEGGPKINPGKSWTSASIYAAMASILNHFDVRTEQNRPYTPGGIKRALARGVGQ